MGTPLVRVNPLVYDVRQRFEIRQLFGLAFAFPFV